MHARSSAGFRVSAVLCSVMRFCVLGLLGVVSAGCSGTAAGYDPGSGVDAQETVMQDAGGADGGVSVSMAAPMPSAAASDSSSDSAPTSAPDSATTDGTLDAGDFGEGATAPVVDSAAPILADSSSVVGVQDAGPTSDDASASTPACMAGGYRMVHGVYVSCNPDGGCVPSCNRQGSPPSSLWCGDDGCGGSCGTCTDGLVCGDGPDGMGVTGVCGTACLLVGTCASDAGPKYRVSCPVGYTGSSTFVRDVKCSVDVANSTPTNTGYCCDSLPPMLRVQVL